MRTAWRHGLAVLFALTAVATGCLRMPGETPPARRWVLSTGIESVQIDSFSSSLGVGPVEIPQYLDRTEIVERLGPNEIRANGFDIWGEPLDLGIRRVLASELAQQVPGLAVVSFPWKEPARVDRRLTVVVTRFEHDIPSGSVVLQVGWALSDTHGGDRIAARLDTFRQPVASDGFEGITDAMSRAVNDLATDIADTLNRFEAAAAPPNG
jgi:uncharacterized lipoprotein YmbA